jgi:hypothetical protein
LGQIELGVSVNEIVALGPDQVKHWSEGDEKIENRKGKSQKRTRKRRKRRKTCTQQRLRSNYWDKIQLEQTKEQQTNKNKGLKREEEKKEKQPKI